MNDKKFLALVSVAVGLSFNFSAYAAKEIRINSNNTAYSDADVQKLTVITVGMGIKGPVSLSSGNGVVAVSGSSATKYTFRVGNSDTPQIRGVSCK